MQDIDPNILRALPEAPESCATSIRAKVAWGVATSAYQVRSGEMGQGMAVASGTVATAAATGEAKGTAAARAAVGQREQQQPQQQLQQQQEQPRD